MIYFTIKGCKSFFPFVTLSNPLEDTLCLFGLKYLYKQRLTELNLSPQEILDSAYNDQTITTPDYKFFLSFDFPNKVTAVSLNNSKLNSSFKVILNAPQCNLIGKFFQNEYHVTFKGPLPYFLTSPNKITRQCAQHMLENPLLHPNVINADLS